MITYFAIAFFILGTIIGSFLNVVIYRLNTGRGLGGRSKCSSCRRILTFIDLVPVLSWLFLKGKCRGCKSKISWQYPLVELSTGILFLFVFLKNISIFERSPLIFTISTIISLVIMSILVVITVYDLKHKIIPDQLSYSFATIAFLQLFLKFDYITSTISFGLPLTFESFLTICSGVFVAFPFFFLWLVSSGKWMGLGDAKLALGIGWLLGISYGFSAIVFAFWIGAIISLLIIGIGYLLNNQKLQLKSEVPFAPFIILGLLIVFFLRISILDFIGLFV